MGAAFPCRRPPRRRIWFILLTLALAVTLSAALNTINRDHSDDDNEDEDNADNDYDYDDDDEDEDFWVEDEDWESSLNITTVEEDISSFVADYMSTVHHLLANVYSNKEARASAQVLENAWAPVKRDAVAVAAAAAVLPGDTRRAVTCAAEAEKEARSMLHRLQDTVAYCYAKSKPEFDPPLPEGDDDNDDDDEDDEAVEREATEFLQLTLALLRATPLFGGSQIADAMSEHEQSTEWLAHHAVMLERRGRSRRERARRCLDLLMEDAYKQADKAREALAACVLYMGVAPPGVDPKDEL